MLIRILEPLSVLMLRDLGIGVVCSTDLLDRKLRVVAGMHFGKARVGAGKNQLVNMKEIEGIVMIGVD